MTAKTRLLATSPSLAQMADAIAQFYCGERKELANDGPGRWKITHPDGTPLQGVFVTQKNARARYRFEMVV